MKNTHSVTKTEISVFGRQALGAERRRSPSLAGKVLINPRNIISNIIMILKINSTRGHTGSLLVYPTEECGEVKQEKDAEEKLA